MTAAAVICFEFLQRFGIRCAQHAALSDDGGDIAGRGDIESRVFYADSAGRELLAGVVALTGWLGTWAETTDLSALIDLSIAMAGVALAGAAVLAGRHVSSPLPGDTWRSVMAPAWRDMAAAAGLLALLVMVGSASFPGPGLCAWSLAAVAVTAVVILFAFKYHRKEATDIGVPIHGDMRLETAWIVFPLILAMAMFAWGAVVYVAFRATPQDTLDIYVIGKQWMWKLQQPTGLKEINELHVPVGRNVRLIMASEDVIHDFAVPAFRVKMDVVPGHYNTMWFRPTKPGRYHFFCSQYCGTNHAIMGGCAYQDRSSGS